jgi:hypothetical protein
MNFRFFPEPRRNVPECVQGFPSLSCKVVNHVFSGAVIFNSPLFQSLRCCCCVEYGVILTYTIFYSDQYDRNRVTAATIVGRTLKRVQTQVRIRCDSPREERDNKRPIPRLPHPVAPANSQKNLPLVQKRARIHIDIDNKPRAKKKDTTRRNLKKLKLRSQ